MLQNYTIDGLQKHTNYVVMVAAKNLKGVGPNASIELRTEDGGENENPFGFVFLGMFRVLDGMRWAKHVERLLFPFAFSKEME